MTTELEAQLEMLLTRWRMEQDKTANAAERLQAAGLGTDIPITQYITISQHIHELEKVLGY